MSADRRGLLVLLTLALAGAPLPAQRITRELGVQFFMLSGNEPLIGAAAYGALRPTSRARISLALGAGDREGTFTGRGELLGHFLLSSARRRGAGVYAAGGLAVDVATEADAWIVGALGVESAPGARSGWMAEVGVGGGWRVAAGWRWRWT